MHIAVLIAAVKRGSQQILWLIHCRTWLSVEVDEYGYLRFLVSGMI